MTGQTSPDFSPCSSPMDYHEEGSTPNNMKSKIRANALYNTPRARRFTERVAEAVEVSSLGRSTDEGMLLDSPSPVRHEDVDMADPSSSPLQLRNNKTIRKRRSIVNKSTEAQQRQRRKLRHTQQLQQQQQKISRGSDDDYEDEDGENESDDEYLHSYNTNTGRSSRRSVVASANNNNNNNRSRQSSVGSEEGANANNSTAATPTRVTTTGRRRRLRLQNTNNTNLDTPEIDEDASPTFFPTKTSRSMSPVIVEPIVLGTTNGVNRNRRRRYDPIAEKLDRLRHAPDINMLDLSQHLIIPDNNNHNNSNSNRTASPSSYTSTTESNPHLQQQHQHQGEQQYEYNNNEQDKKENQSNSDEDREESPIAIPDCGDNDGDDDDDDDMDMDMEEISQEEAEAVGKSQEFETGISSVTTTKQVQRHSSSDNLQESPLFEGSNPIGTQEQPVSPSTILDTTIESPSSPITPQPMTMTGDTSNNSSKKILAQNNDTNITTNQPSQQEQKQDSTPLATQSEMELSTGEQQREAFMDQINNNETYNKDVKTEEGEKGHDKQNTYLGRVVGSVSRFFWGS